MALPMDKSLLMVPLKEALQIMFVNLDMNWLEQAKEDVHQVMSSGLVMYQSAEVSLVS